MNLDELLEGAHHYSELRERLCRNVPNCSACGEVFQIQLTNWIDEISWKCRICNHKWLGDTNDAS
jgi:hypothetical protein